VSHRSLILVSASALALFATVSNAQTSDAPAQAEQAATAAANTTGLEEVVVTARRREEKAQQTPISVSAFSAESLRQKDVEEVQDLNTIVPGFHFGQEGGKNTNNVTLRGLSRIPLGSGIPAVVSYFADVPLPGLGSNIPTFDLSNIQVLKGPQGTLFGRNTLGGAIVITPAAPGPDFEGYIDAQIGNLDHHTFEGAVNIPIVEDKVALRVSGQLRRQDGYVKNLNGGPDFSDTNQDAYRISLLLQPTDWLKNTLVYDYFVAPERAGGLYLLGTHPGVVPGLSPLIDPQIAAYAAAQKAAGPYASFSDLPNGAGRAFRRLSGVTNDTRIDLTDDLQIHNILGFRKAFNDQEINTGGVGPMTITIPGLGTVPFTLFHASEVDDQEYFTDELQLVGNALNGRLNWILGGFMNHDYSAGPAGSNFVAFSVGGTSPGTFLTSQVENHNYAIYGQGGLDLSDWVLDGLTLNLGYRFSWDQVHSCGGSFVGGYVTADQCEAAAKLHVIGGAGDVGAEGSDPSWTVGFDYKYSDKQFFYVTSRRGYRGVNVNSPLFTSAFTTGGVVVPPFVGGPGCSGPGNKCPDLRPFQTTKPEKLTDVEIGSKTDWEFEGITGRVDVAAYWSQYSNALQFFNVLGTGIYAAAPDLPNNQSVGINAADETIMGIELGLTVQPTSDLTISFDGAYTDAEIDKVASPTTTGLSLSKDQITLPSPKFAGSVAVRWVLPVHPLDSDLVLNGDYYQTGQFSGQYGVKLPGYGIGNARLDWQNIAQTRVDVGLYVRNIFDRAYIASPSVLLQTFPVQSVYYGEPQTYGVELRYSF
jgi:iron complex outermembrane receptor protein